MRKLVFILLCFPCKVHAQSIISIAPPRLAIGISLSSDLLFSNCGTLKDTVTYTDWISIDTIGKHKITDTARNWVYDDVEKSLDNNKETFAVYCPCGCLWDSHWYQYRICKITGIEQQRLKTRHWWRVPPPEPPKSEFEKTKDSLQNSLNQQ